MNYANSKLLMGILNVGTWVLFSLLAILGYMQISLPGIEANLYETLGGVVVLYFLYAIIQLPFDLIGGIFIPYLHGKLPKGISRRLVEIIRGIFVLGSIFVLISLFFITLAKTSGFIGVLLACLTTQTLFLTFQSFFAQILSDFQYGKERDLNSIKFSRVSEHSSEFTGGISGLPGLEKFLIPAEWLDELRTDLQSTLTKRYNLISKSGERIRGLSLALLWNLLGVALVSLFVTLPDSVYQLYYFICTFTLWSFIGLLILPTASKNSTFKIDKTLISEDTNKEDLIELMTFISKKSGEKYSRKSIEEIIFHPAASVSERLAALENTDSPKWFRGWNASRTSIFLSGGCLNLLSRAVHGNIGRPELWVFLPVE